MATGPHHYRKAEQLLARAVKTSDDDLSHYCIAAAHVHAQLAQTAATLVTQLSVTPGELEQWRTVVQGLPAEQTEDGRLTYYRDCDTALDTVLAVLARRGVSTVHKDVLLGDIADRVVAALGEVEDLDTDTMQRAHRVRAVRRSLAGVVVADNHAALAWAIVDELFPPTAKPVGDATAHAARREAVMRALHGLERSDLHFTGPEAADVILAALDGVGA